MGANVPSWLVKLLKASANIVEAAGDLTSESNEAFKGPMLEKETADAVRRADEAVTE